MYLSDRDIAWAIKTGDLIIDPPPEKIDETSVDLHLASVEHARIWDIDRFAQKQSQAGHAHPELRIAKYNLKEFAKDYSTKLPEYNPGDANQKVGRRTNQAIVMPGGFLLWQTREVVGTPRENADLICFVNGKSTRARAGIVVHLTAPTIHAAWKGVVVLEIANLGPFDILLEEGDAIAQLTVARITSTPDQTLGATSLTYAQQDVSGASPESGGD